MNQTSLSLCALGLLLAAACDADAQCRKFTKQRVISSLDVDQAIDQIKTGTLGRGESAAAVLEVEASGTVDLIVCTHPDLGEVTYNVVNAIGEGGFSRVMLVRTKVRGGAARARDVASSCRGGRRT